MRHRCRMVHSGWARYLTEAGAGKAKPTCPAVSLLGLKGPHALLSRTHRRSPVLLAANKTSAVSALRTSAVSALRTSAVSGFSVGSVPIHTFRVEGPNPVAAQSPKRGRLANWSKRQNRGARGRLPSDRLVTPGQPS
jgi:hypothetical protein